MSNSSDNATNDTFHVVPSHTQDFGGPSDLHDEGTSILQDSEQENDHSNNDQDHDHDPDPDPDHVSESANHVEDDEIHAPPQLNPTVLFVINLIKSSLRPFFRIVFAPSAQRTVVKTTILSFSIMWILMTSITAYTLFYRRHVPQIIHTEPIWFQYGSMSRPGELTSSPVGAVDLLRGDHYPILRHDQGYDVSVRLHVPTSDINFNLGNFMVSVNLETSNSSVVASSSRPAILRYQSNTQRVLRVFAKALPLLVGLTEESQVIYVPMIEGYIEQKAAPVVHATVSLSSPLVQVYDAELSIIADFRGLRYYMYHHRVATAIVFAIMFATIEFICAVIAWRVFGQGLWNKLNDAFEQNNNGSEIEDTKTIDDEHERHDGDAEFVDPSDTDTQK
ncbi:putative adipose-regulatory protein-domain-containing protein [Phycomyces blakesleeanus]